MMIIIIIIIIVKFVNNYEFFTFKIRKIRCLVT